MRTRLAVTALATAAALIAPATAAAHVTLNPKSGAAGSYSVFDVRVPNERDDASTTKVDVKLPDGFVTASYEPTPGWRVRVIRERLARPIETDDGPIEEQVSRVIWTGDGSPQGSIPPGAFRDFPLSVKLPDDPGATLTFKALQTYSNGEVVRWIGSPDSESPAPQVALTAAADEGTGAGAGHGGGAAAGSGGDAADEGATAPVSDQQPAAADSDDGGGASTGLVIVALLIGALGLLAGGAALLRGGSGRAPSAG